MLNKMYDIVVVGASRHGVDFCNSLYQNTNKNKRPNVLLVSSNFKQAEKLDTSVNTLTDSVVFLSYNRGLIELTLKSRLKIYCTKLVFAIGGKPIKTDRTPEDVFYKHSDISNLNKTKNVVLVGGSNQAIDTALEVAKKCKKVIIITDSFELGCDEERKALVAETQNIVHLPGTRIAEYKTNNKGKLSTIIVLDNYTEINCGCVLVVLGRVPDVNLITNGLVTIDTKGYIETKENYMTAIVPDVYAIGECTKNHREDDGSKLADYLSNKYMWL